MPALSCASGLTPDPRLPEQVFSPSPQHLLLLVSSGLIWSSLPTLQRRVLTLHHDCHAHLDQSFSPVKALLCAGGAKVQRRTRW